MDFCTPSKRWILFSPAGGDRDKSYNVIVMIYSYARVRALGLGNLLFPWARAVVATDKYGLTPIWPTWFQPRVGPFLRREKDKRLYFDLFSRPSYYVGGIRKLRLLRAAERISEATINDDPAALATTGERNRIVEFSGMGGYFQSILTDHDLVRRELINMTRPHHKRSLAFDFSGSVSVHVRMGEFTVPSDASVLKTGAENLRHPMSWYAEQVTRIRRACGRDITAYVFSDGTDEELAELLALPNTRRMFFGSSLGDLLALSRAEVLVASGSTFSMWASYLGRMPVIWHTGQIRQRLYYDRPDFEIQSDGREDDPANALNLVAERICDGMPMAAGL